MNLICFGVRDIEIDFFYKLNVYNFTIELVKDNLCINNVNLCKNFDAIMVRGNCDLGKSVLKELKKCNVKYILTRTVGLDHIDINYAIENNFRVAYVPSYSPNAVSELVVIYALNLLRNIPYTLEKTSRFNFKIDSNMFSREIRNCTVGVIGTGKIGITTAKLFKGLGANIIGFDIRENCEFKNYGVYVSIDELYTTSDIITLHIPYIKNLNHHLINKDVLKKMKPNSILINTSRGQIVDINAVIEAIKCGKLAGFGTDVLEEEKSIFNKEFESDRIKQINETLFELVNLYPKVLITPHIGSYTDCALINMISISYENLKCLYNNELCLNEVTKKKED